MHPHADWERSADNCRVEGITVESESDGKEEKVPPIAVEVCRPVDRGIGGRGREKERDHAG